MIRSAVAQLVCNPMLRLTDDSDAATLTWAQVLITSLEPPATKEEASALLPLLSRGDDSDCYGLVWALLHFIESSPDWPPVDALRESSGPWPDRLKQGLINAGRWLV